MKKIIIVVVILCFALYSNAQSTYNVIKVSGNISITQTNELLKTGTKFEEEDELDFKSPNARAAVIHPSKGRFILKNTNSDIAYARAYLTPSKSNISSRAGALVNKLDLEKYFGDNYVIIEEAKMKVSPISFKMDDNNFFFMRYLYNNEVINKKLTFTDDTLIINESELFKIDGNSIPNDGISQMSLFYMSQEKGGTIKISTCNLTFLKSVELQDEINVILMSIPNKSEDEKVSEITDYLNEIYGKIDKTNVSLWLKKNNKL